MEDGWSCDWLDEVQVEKNGFETTFPSYSLHIGWGTSINRWTEESKISSICSQTEIQDRFQEHWVSCGWVTRDGTEKAKNVGCFSNRKYSVCYAMLCYAKSLQWLSLLQNILYFILKAKKAPFMFIYEYKKNELCLRKIIMVTCEK